jgi:hypothetical protein
MQMERIGRVARLNEKTGAVFSPEAAFAQPAPAGAEHAPGPCSVSDVLGSSRLVTENLGLLTIAHAENWQVFTSRQNVPESRSFGRNLFCGPNE